MSALRSELLAHSLLDWRVNDNRLLRSADRSIIKTRSCQDFLHSFRHIGCAFYDDRNIARSDDECWFPRRLFRTHMAYAARCAVVGGLVMLHQSFSSFTLCG